MSDNLRHWDALCHTDPKHTKPFQRAGGFKGTAIKPIWSVLRMTEHFGPSGIGWGTDKPEFTVQQAGDEILVFCTAAVWYCDPEHTDAKRYIFGVGGDKVVIKGREGSRTNDEAFKAAYTDALSNAFKQIGVGADVHMGLFDDAKYVREMREEFAEEAPREPAQRTNPAGPSQVTPPPSPRPAPSAVAGPRDEAFFRGKSYEIPPKAAGGTVKLWREAVDNALRGMRHIDELAKFENDNRGHVANYTEKAKVEDVNSLLALLKATEERLKRIATAA